MKATKKGGFTLIELLVVISIIAILTALVSGAVGRALLRAKMLEARNQSINLVQAIESYYNEYGYFPNASNGFSYQEDTLFQTDNSNLLAILTGENSEENPKKIVFYRGKQAKNKEGAGLDFHNTAETGNVKLRDPWLNPFLVLIDTNYDEKVNTPHNVILRGKRIICWSKGKDKKENSIKNHKENRDNIYSW